MDLGFTVDELQDATRRLVAESGLDDAYVRTLEVVGYPRSVHPGWLRPLLEFDEPLDVAIHLFPLESPAVDRP